MEGDEGQLKQAINNLLVNALQAMPSGGTLELAAENTELAGEGSPLPPGKYVRVTVSDTGIGIPKEYLERVFEPYFTTKTQGHGLGLSMTWSVVKNHGGHIAAASEPGKGTQFELLLPATGRRMNARPAQSREISKGSGRILLLEDEDIVVRAARRMMTELGYECAVTGDGSETLALYAAEKAAGKPFDAVIMDLTIPGGMGGKEAGAELRRRHPEAVIIVSSGYSDEPVMADYKAFGFDAVLPTPYRYEDLDDTLARLLVKNKAT
jgi:CheY-like chemotaxis protein